VCYREKEKKAEELQKEEDEALQQKAKLEDVLMERRRLEERRKKVELGYGEANVIFVIIVLLQLETVRCLIAVWTCIRFLKISRMYNQPEIYFSVKNI
jgi:hypothetical protein